MPIYAYTHAYMYALFINPPLPPFCQEDLHRHARPCFLTVGVGQQMYIWLIIVARVSRSIDLFD